jgi:hypothetical protein
VALLKGITVYNSGSFFFAEGVAFLKGLLYIIVVPFSLLKAWPYERDYCI